jgi:hypothetical protein
MKRLLILFFFYILFSFELQAQKDSSNHHLPVGFSCNIGISTIDVDNLNNKLSEFNYPKLLNYQFYIYGSILLGGIKDIEYNSFDFGFKGQTSKSMNSNKISISIYQTGYNMNFNLKSHGKILIQPFIGWSIYGPIIRITNNSYKPENTDSVFTNLKGLSEMTIKNTLWLVNVGVAFNKSINKEEDWILGLRTGYKIQVNKPKWVYNNISIDDFPKLNFSEFYLCLTFSFY